MPTALQRIQTLLNPELYAEVATLAKHQRRTMSAMAAELITVALKTDNIKAQLEEAVIKVPAQPDPRQTRPQTQYKQQLGEQAVAGLDISHHKLDKLMKLLEVLDGE